MKAKADSYEMMQMLGFGGYDEGMGKVSPVNGAMTGLTFIGLGGLIVFMILIRTLLVNGMPPHLITAIAGFYLVTLFGICFLLIRQMNKFTDVTKNRGDEPRQTQELTGQYTAPASAPVLNEYRESVHSVIDHTTKNFDEVPVERKTE